MRSVSLDIETTGFEPLEGHKIVEIGCVELIDNFPSGKIWQKYINPERSMPNDAFKVHGLSEDFLSNKPVFSDIANDFLKFIKDSSLIIHNAKFDLKFINHELEVINIKPIDIESDKIIDTIDIAKKLFPGQSVSLDALCKRYKINVDRKLHGALLDAELLTEVFLEMHGGRQQYMNLVSNFRTDKSEMDNKKIKYSKDIYNLTKEELDYHEKLLEYINNY